MTDSPDWTQRAQLTGPVSITGPVTIDNIQTGIIEAHGRLRYVGPLSLTIPGGGSVQATLPVPLQTIERAIVVMTPQLPASVSQHVSVDEPVSGVVSLDGLAVSHLAQPVIAYANPDLAAGWQATVELSGPPGGPYTYYVFTDSSLPVTGVVSVGAALPVFYDRLGQSTAAGSVPAVLASDQPTLNVQQGWLRSGSVGISGITSTLPANAWGGLQPIVARPGANKELCILGFQVTAPSSIAAGTVATALFQNSSGDQLWQGSISDKRPGDRIWFGWPGIRLFLNEGVNAQYAASVGVASAGAFCWYYIITP